MSPVHKLMGSVLMYYMPLKEKRQCLQKIVIILTLKSGSIPLLRRKVIFFSGSHLSEAVSKLCREQRRKVH